MDKLQPNGGEVVQDRKLKADRWEPPRGIRLLEFPTRPAQPYAVQWRLEGKRKTKTFPTREKQIAFAKQLAGDFKRDGLAAFRLNTDEARQWRQFRADIGDAKLDDVLRVWRRYGNRTTGITVPQAVESFLTAKAAEGVSEASLGHFRPVFRRLEAALGKVDAATVERAALESYVAGLDTESAETRRTHFKRIRSLFTWLQATRQIPANPCDGWKAPRADVNAITVMPVEDGKKLFGETLSAKDAPHKREILGRLALEAFCGMRNDTAAQIGADAFDFKGRVITVAAQIDKNRKTQFIEHAEDNLWQWLEWSDPKSWKLTRRQYMTEKADAFTRAKISHARNVLRHSAASYHIAKHGDAGKTAAMLTHSNLKMLWAHYRGKGGGKANGEAWFAIVPPASANAEKGDAPNA